MSARSFIKGPRFSSKNPAKETGCQKCVYDTGEHAEWCPRRNSSTAQGERNSLPDVFYLDSFWKGLSL